MAKKYKVKGGRFGEYDAGTKLTEAQVTEGGWNLNVLLARGVIVELNGENEEVPYVPTGDEEQPAVLADEARVIAQAEAEIRDRAIDQRAPQPQPVSESTEAELTPAEKRAATLAAKKAADDRDDNRD